jgi:hypothetical protein
MSTGIFILLSGCINFSAVPPVANGYVYLDGKVIGGATVEAISADGTDRQSTTTDGTGAYVLNITPAKRYNITATYQGLRHTVWPVYLDNKTDMYNIDLTTTPRSAIKGIGYATREGEPYEGNMGVLSVELTPTIKNHTTFSMRLENDGKYSMEVDPDVQYRMRGTFSGGEVAGFYYHNTEYVRDNLITIGPNETALIDIKYRLP